MLLYKGQKVHGDFGTPSNNPHSISNNLNPLGLQSAGFEEVITHISHHLTLSCVINDQRVTVATPESAREKFIELFNGKLVRSFDSHSNSYDWSDNFSIDWFGNSDYSQEFIHRVLRDLPKPELMAQPEYSINLQPFKLMAYCGRTLGNYYAHVLDFGSVPTSTF